MYRVSKIFTLGPLLTGIVLLTKKNKYIGTIEDASISYRPHHKQYGKYVTHLAFLDVISNDSKLTNVKEVEKTTSSFQLIYVPRLIFLAI